jgi:hypothetical protein
MSDYPTLREFFFETLTSWASELYSPPELIEEVKLEIQTHIEGEGGLSFVVSLDLGDYSVREGQSSDPFVTIQSNQQQWKASLPLWYPRLRKELDDAGGVEAYIEKLLDEAKRRGHKIPRLTEAKLEALRSDPAVIEARIDGTPQGDLHVKLGLWTKNLNRAPDFVLRMDYATAQALQERRLDPVVAWKQKQINLEGNLALALRIGRTLAKPL